jgi:CrcB protein
MVKLIAIAAGGAAGTLMRYAFGGAMHRLLGSTFPWGTLGVNLAGSLVIGFLWGLFENALVSSTVRSFAFIGVLGGFTTFSSLMIESMNLARDGETRLALFNLLASNMGGMALVAAGLLLARMLVK